jgi:signal transduction histidine kinase
VPDAERSELPANLARRWGIASLIATPIMRGEEIVGILSATYRTRTGPFSPRQRRLIVGIAHATAIALENARLIADLQAASRLKTEFVSTMSHELRTPLNVILGFCEMARDPALTRADLGVYHDRIELAGRHLLELVESTLEIGKLESGRDDLQLERVELPVFWERLGREYAVRPRNDQVVLEWSPSAPAVELLVDPRKLAMIVRNLVSNALKFTDHGFVRVAAFLDGDTVVLRVADTGIGIAPGDHERIFEMFRQGDGSDSRRHAGTGLGLYIVRRFAHQLGGRVHVDSEAGRGAVFTVRLPTAGLRALDETIRATG